MEGVGEVGGGDRIGGLLGLHRGLHHPVVHSKLVQILAVPLGTGRDLLDLLRQEVWRCGRCGRRARRGEAGGGSGGLVRTLASGRLIDGALEWRSTKQARQKNH